MPNMNNLFIIATRVMILVFIPNGILTKMTIDLPLLTFYFIIKRVDPTYIGIDTKIIILEAIINKLWLFGISRSMADNRKWNFMSLLKRLTQLI